MNRSRAALLAAAACLLARPGPAPAASLCGELSPEGILDGRLAPSGSFAVDLAGLFPRAERNQQAAGNCAVFAVAGLIEAALEKEGLGREKLSEYDFFLQSRVLRGDFYGQPDAFERVRGAGALVEGQELERAVFFALSHGVATDRTAPYDHLFWRYERWRGAELKVMEAVRRHLRDNRPANPVDWLAERWYSGDPPSGHWASLQNEPDRLRARERQLLGPVAPEGLLREDRRRIKAKLDKLRPEFQAGPYFPARPPAAECRGRARDMNRFILRHLCAGRPVAAAMNATGLPEWGRSDGAAFRHAFLITGAGVLPPEAAAVLGPDRGGIFYLTRNSWGGKGPAIPEEKSCLIYGAAALAGAGH